MWERRSRADAPMLGWYIFVRKRTFGGAIGYSSGRNSSRRNTPSTPAPATPVTAHIHIAPKVHTNIGGK